MSGSPPGRLRFLPGTWALLLILWGVWHVPIILTGEHTYPPTPEGFTLCLLFFLLWGFVQSYSVFKTGSVWTAAFLHGVVNGVYGFLRTAVERPYDRLAAFGLGVFGLVCLFGVVLIILRDPVWSLKDGRALPSGEGRRGTIRVGVVVDD